MPTLMDAQPKPARRAPPRERPSKLRPEDSSAYTLRFERVTWEPFKHSTIVKRVQGGAAEHMRMVLRRYVRAQMETGRISGDPAVFDAELAKLGITNPYPPR